MNVLLLRHNLHQWVLDRAEQTYVVLDDSPGCRALPPERLARFSGVYWVSSYDSLEELAGVAADLKINGVRIDRVASFTEFTQYAAGYLANLLGLDHFTPTLAMNTRDKRVMKTLAREAGLAVPRFVSIPNGGRDADVDAIVDAVGLPLVLKPANGFGTMSTMRVGSRDELAVALADYTFEAALRSHHLVAEEFIRGEEFHVDAVWRDGKPWVFFVSRYFTPRLAMWIDGGLNGSALLREEHYTDLYAQIRDFHRRLNQAVGLSSGTTHLELFRDTNGRLVFSELASRMSGSNIGDVVQARCGVHLGMLALHELLGADPAELALAEGEFRYVGYIHIGPERSGVITSLPSREEYLAHPHIVAVNTFLKVGDSIDVTHPSAWCTLAVIGADDEAQLEWQAADVVRKYTVEVA